MKIFLKIWFLKIGAAIEKGRLKELNQDSAPLMAAPNCRIAFVATSENEETYEDQLEVPVYEDTDRSSLIYELPVKCMDRYTWLQRGVALYLQTHC